MKKCPPGVICIENITLLLIFICIFIAVYLLYTNLKANNIVVNNNPSEKIVIKENSRENSGGWFGGILPSWPYNNLTNDVLLNPYAAPLSDERYFLPSLNYIPRGTVPINISTNVGAVDTSYRQIGILTPFNGKQKDNILALMGRPVFTNRDKWQYYTISNQHNNVKLPISVKGKSGSNEYGVDRIYNGDTVYVEGINEAFRVTVYDNDTIKYLPAL
uniref:Uncharacterized protein n=1 Tax=viral metagenome TaxID=1070528 RepID=A0A6C0ES97_9ZZZZ